MGIGVGYHHDTFQQVDNDERQIELSCCLFSQLDTFYHMMNENRSNCAPSLVSHLLIHWRS